jgi:hypothetical protein
LSFGNIFGIIFRLFLSLKRANSKILWVEKEWQCRLSHSLHFHLTSLSFRSSFMSIVLFICAWMNEEIVFLLFFSAIYNNTTNIWNQVLYVYFMFFGKQTKLLWAHKSHLLVPNLSSSIFFNLLRAFHYRENIADTKKIQYHDISRVNMNLAQIYFSLNFQFCSSVIFVSAFIKL